MRRARRGIEPIELRRGEDLETIGAGAVDDGANALAMAGGDGSQAIVAMVAAELDLPYACIPAGTRNHFALDLGVDRDDVVGALDAFVNGGERRVDLAEVNGRVFVNNVSLGLYAEAVQQPGYREAKLHTLLETVPDALGPDAKPPDLLWRSPDRRRVGRRRPRLQQRLPPRPRARLGHAAAARQAVLGVTVLAPTTASGGAVASAQLGMQQWITPTFEIDAGSPVAAGIDGEALLPRSAAALPDPRPAHCASGSRPIIPGASPSALEPDKAWQMVGTLAIVRVPRRAAPTRRRFDDRRPGEDGAGIDELHPVLQGAAGLGHRGGRLAARGRLRRPGRDLVVVRWTAAGVRGVSRQPRGGAVEVDRVVPREVE